MTKIKSEGKVVKVNRRAMPKTANDPSLKTAREMAGEFEEFTHKQRVKQSPRVSTESKPVKTGSNIKVSNDSTRYPTRSETVKSKASGVKQKVAAERARRKAINAPAKKAVANVVKRAAGPVGVAITLGEIGQALDRYVQKGEGRPYMTRRPRGQHYVTREETNKRLSDETNKRK